MVDGENSLKLLRKNENAEKFVKTSEKIEKRKVIN